MRPDLSLAQLRERVRRAAGAQGRLPGSQAAIEERVRQEQREQRYVLVSVHTIRKLNRQGIQFSML